VRGLGQALDRLGHQLRDGAEGGYSSQMLRLEVGEQRRAFLESWTGSARTSDGSHVKLLANVADTKSAEQAARGPVEGSGLFRTELCFPNRKDEPSGGAGRPPRRGARGLRAGAHGGRADPRRRVGQAGRLRHGGGRGEPALGVRRLRLSFGNPGLLVRQLDAIALAAKQSGTTPWVMAPMVATVEEAQVFADQVRERGLRAGVMVEVSGSALLAHRFLEVVDFQSIGTKTT